MVSVYFGPNSQRIQEQVRLRVADFLAQHGDQIERFDGAELNSADDVLNAVRGLSLFDENKLVVVRSFTESKELLEKIETIVEQCADTCELVLYSEKLDKRSSYYKYLKKHTTLEEFGVVSPVELAQWVHKHATELGVNISQSDIRYLIDRVGDDQMILQRELEKLAIAGATITKEHIDILTDMTPHSSIFMMLESLFSGERARAWKLYLEQRTLGEDPHKILAMLTWQLQQLTLVVFAPDTETTTLTAAGMTPYAAQKTKRIASRISRNELKTLITSLHDLDVQIKTSADPESALAVFFSEVGI